MKEEKKLKNFISKNKQYIFIILISIIVSVPMFMPNFNMQYDDGVQHICRLIGTEQSINEGQLFPVIMSNFCNGFGYSWNLFYSPFTAYAPLIFRIFGLSFEICLKLFMLLISILTGLAMYFYIMKITKNKEIAIFAAALYILVPYRLNDMYFRMAISELTTFIFLPIIFNGLYTIIKLKQKTCLLIIRSSRNATYTQYAYCLCSYFLYYIFVSKYKGNKKRCINFIISKCNMDFTFNYVLLGSTYRK